jgi:hypothetical protein
LIVVMTVDLHLETATMDTTTRMLLRSRSLVVLAVLFLTLAASPPAVRAVTPAGQVALPLAASDDNNYSIRKFFAGMNRRERVVQLCVAVMCLALFILCKKFTDDAR